MKFNIFAKLKEEIDDYETNGYYLTGKPKNLIETKHSAKGEKGGYYYSQRDVLEAIDLASASKFKKGIKDRENQRKIYLNIVNFYRDVMKMKINVDVSNYIFEPTASDFGWPVFLMDRQFKQFAEDESYDDLIDEYAGDLATYGTVVSKILSECSERVPLRTLRNTQSAKTLMDAALNGGYVHIENEFHYNKMKRYPGWQLQGVSKHDMTVVVERYALVPKKLYENWKEQIEVEINADEDMIAVMAILAPHVKDPAKNTEGKILFMEEIDEDSFPLDEAHAEKKDGRWLGIGEIEKQLENQIARNLTANLRRRGLLWATKKVYQSSDDEVQKNLVMEVNDGDILKVKPNGQITQVNTQNQHLADFKQDEDNIKENSQQISFAFNSSTGEDMPSNTPFSLGVMLNRQTADHFKLVRKTFSNFLKRCFFNQVILSFQREYEEEHTLQIPIGATDIANMREAMTIWHVNTRMFNEVLKTGTADIEKIRMQVADEQARSNYLFATMPEDFYPKAGYYMRLNLVDDIGPDIASLTTLYQSMTAKGDPRAEIVLKLIFQRQGKNLDAMVGQAPKPVAPTQMVPNAAAPAAAPTLPAPVANA